ncbi:hypothetical protein PG985_014873 [Apiospora marii]|uniref:Uncharacterized protein n=1 Tax=Apiospora marii TaxID=335849 RepID=A0ABR1RL38_9PEZI
MTTTAPAHAALSSGRVKLRHPSLNFRAGSRPEQAPAPGAQACGACPWRPVERRGARAPSSGPPPAATSSRLPASPAAARARGIFRLLGPASQGSLCALAAAAAVSRAAFLAYRVDAAAGVAVDPESDFDLLVNCCLLLIIIPEESRILLQLLEHHGLDLGHLQLRRLGDVLPPRRPDRFGDANLIVLLPVLEHEIQRLGDGLLGGEPQHG